MSNQDQPYEIELSLLYMHLRDARKFDNLAKSEKTKLRSLYARHSTLSVVFALEAIINRVYDDFYLNQVKPNPFEKLNLIEKWIVAPLVCGKDKPIGKKFDRSKEPFQSFEELIRIRNWFVHPKPGDYVPAVETPWTILIEMDSLEVQGIEIKVGSTWPQTKIPKNPFELTGEHSEKALKTFDMMKNELLEVFKGIIDEKWLWKIRKKSIKTDMVDIDNLWGGYTPEPEDE